MNILFDIGHPGQVHLLKYTIEKLKKRGHKVLVTVKDIPAAKILLDLFGIRYISLGKKFDNVALKGLSQLKYDYNLFRIAKENNIDLAIGSSITIAHISIIHKCKSIILDDDDAEAVKLFSMFAHPFADCIISPVALAHQRNNKKGVTYNGTHELFYLHPSYFKPDPTVLRESGLTDKEKFFIVRLVSGKAYHDKGEKWMSDKQKRQLIEMLSNYGRIIITAERGIDNDLEKYRMKVSPDKIHHLMYYATLFVGDSQTMTSEAAILGTPSLKCNSFAHKLSIPNMLENKYDLCYSFQPDEFNQMLKKISSLLNQDDLKEKWKLKKEQFLSDSIDPSAFLCWFIEEWPSSFSQIKKDPDCQFNFR